MNGVKKLCLIEQYNDSHAAIITLNNSKEGNILNIGSLEELLKALTSAMEDTEVRVIILRSNEDTFCLGMDLKMLQSIKKNKEIAEKSISLYIQLLSLIYTGPKPVICLINGDVKAGGIGLVGACDIVLASRKASFEFSEVFFGLIPANALPFVYSLRLPPQKIRYLILTAKKISAEEAHQLNLVDEVYSEEEIEKGLKSIVKNLFRASPDAIAETKQFTRALFGEKTDKATNMAKEKLLELISNPEVIEAITAFNEGNTPKWFDKFKPEKSLIK